MSVAYFRSLGRRAIRAIRNRLFRTRPHQETSQKRRIVYIDVGSGSGGSSVSLERLLAVLDRARWDPVVLTHQFGHSSENMRHSGIPVQTLPLRPTGRAKGLLWNAIFFYTPLFIRLVRIFQRMKPDLVHLNNSPKEPPAAVFAARLLGIPVVAHLRTTRPLTRLELFLTKYLEAVIPLSRTVQEIFKLQGVPPGKIFHIPDGVDIEAILSSRHSQDEARKRLGILNGEPIVGVVARLMPQKGQEQFIQAMGEVVKKVPAARTVIVGDECESSSGYLSHLKAFVEKQGLSGNIQFTSWVENPETLYPAFTIFAQTSLLPEGFSRVCLEAMAHGVPVVSTRVGAVPELVEDGMTGLLVSPGDPKAFADALLHLLKEEGIRLKMAQAAIAHAKQFDIQRTKALTEALYDEVLKR